MSSIRARLLWTLLTGVSIALIVGGVSLQWVTSRTLRNQFRASLLAQARSLGSLVMIDEGELEIEVDTGGSLPAIYRVEIPVGEVIAQAGRFEWEEDGPTRIASDEPSWSEVELPGDSDGTAVTIGVMPRVETDVEGHDPDAQPFERVVLVTVVGDDTPLERAVAGVSAAIVGTGLLVLITAGGLVLWGVRIGLRPLDRLATELGGVQPEHPAPIGSPEESPRELRPVYEALDRMLTRLGETMDRERRFTDAAAHELRTPLAELRTAVDVARRWPEPQRTTQTLDNADQIVERMSGLIEALLLLSRNPSEMAASGVGSIPVADEVRAELDRVSARAQGSGIELMFLLNEPGTWTLPEPVATILVRNLLSNAVEYTPRGGSVEAVVRTTGGTPELCVSNGPVSLDADQVGHLFEPFWRAEGSRTDQSHHGLGLAVVRHVCSACGLECDATLADRTLTIRVRPSGSPESTRGTAHG